jgi:hypothetical protein
MAKLTRLRFVSVGHPSARMRDFLLDLRDAQGRATDSTLWLRNGGGKSSLLNLFFALVRPDKREFMGGKDEKRLEDYVRPSDHSVVLCEWELDASGTLAFSDEPSRFLTGVFYEYRTAGASDDGRLRRLFFAARCSAEDPRVTLEGLPLFFRGADGGNVRRTLTSFRAEWTALRDLYPHLEMRFTENQRDWEESLEGAGIDPELFKYQIRMNEREGGVAEIFRFTEHEEFIDFLIELALEPSTGERAVRNVVTFRRELSERKNVLLPERELAAGLVSLLEPLQRVHAERDQLETRTGSAATALAAAGAYLEGRLSALQSEETEQLEAGRREREAAQEARGRADREIRRAAGLRLYGAQVRHRELADALESARANRDKSRRVSQLWEAACPLANALRCEEQARQYAELLTHREEEHTPLLVDLQKAAALFASALEFRRQKSQEAEMLARAAETTARQRERDDWKLAAKFGGQADVFVAQTGQFEHKIAQAAAERERLCTAGVLVQGESGVHAVDRLATDLQGAELRMTIVAAQLDAAHRNAYDLETQVATAHEQSTLATASATERERQFKRALAERVALQGEPLLRELFGLETVDIERLPPDSLEQLRRAAHSALERIVDLKSDGAVNERAVIHLEASELLPPSADTQGVLKTLRARLPAVWSGWEYIESNVAAEFRRETVQNHAQIATGVIVRDADFAKACELLSVDGVFIPDGPITVAPSSALNLEIDPEGKVFGPASSAYFDRAAGRSELARRQVRLETTERSLNYQHEVRHAIESLASSFDHFRQRYPMGWFAEEQSQCERARNTAEENARHLEKLRAAAAATGLKIAEIDQETKDLAARRLELKHQGESLAQFLRLFELCEAAWIEQLDLSRRESGRCRDQQHALEGTATEWGLLAEDSAERVSSQKAESVMLSTEIAGIHYTVGQIVAAAGPVEILKDRYGSLRIEYEGKIDAHGLLALRRREEQQAGEARKTLAKRLPAGMTEADVRAELDQLADPGDADSRRLLATAADHSAQGRYGTSLQAEQRAQAELTEAQEKGRSLGVEDSEPAASPEEADHQAQISEYNAEVLRGDSSQHELRAEGATQRAQECTQMAIGVRKDRGRLNTIYKAYAELLAAPAGGAPISALASDADCESLMNEADAELDSAKEQTRCLDKQRQACAHEIRAWTQRFDSLKSQVGARFAVFDEAELEGRAGEWRNVLETRRDTITAQIADMDKHRDLLISETLAAADDALVLLRSAQSQSRLPDDVPGLGGEQFLRITLSVPEDGAEKRARIGSLIDELVDAGEIPRGLKLVQQAVRRLARPIRARVLKPDPNMSPQAVDITQMQAFSGGEKLTCAILLYCTLAQLRQRQRTVGRRPSSVLILDNPIGTASRASFLDMQRHVASAMGVQLFYVTGVSDYDALSVFPNLIRVRNDKVDRNTGERVLELGETSRLESVRIVRVIE